MRTSAVARRARAALLGLALGGVLSSACGKATAPRGAVPEPSSMTAAQAASVDLSASPSAAALRAATSPSASVVASPPSLGSSPVASAVASTVSSTVASAVSSAVPAEPGACPEDMVLVQGSFCTEVVQTCEKNRLPWQCQTFASPTVCKGKEEPRRYCIDTYEYPNKKGEMALVMQSWWDAKRTCEKLHKRLCTDSEWTLACEGPERLPFPYGYERDSTICPIDKPSLKVDEKRLFSKRHGLEEVARLDQREPSGTREKCVSAYGVHDLTGNVDEWVVNETGNPYKGSLKGGNWGEYRNACRPATRGHGEGFRYYQMGFRCCGEAK